jgi:hypothetical protein
MRELWNELRLVIAERLAVAAVHVTPRDSFERGALAWALHEYGRVVVRVEDFNESEVRWLAAFREQWPLSASSPSE